MLRPTSDADAVAVLDWCGDAGIALVPFGGGTSVVGGVEPDVGPEWAGVDHPPPRHRPDHGRWYAGQRPAPFAAALAAAERALDPRGVLNPGLLVQTAAPSE